MTWQQVVLIVALLAASIALVMLDQATLAGGLATTVAGIVGLLFRSPIPSIADRKPTADEPPAVDGQNTPTVDGDN